MIQRLAEIAPLSTWALTIGAALLLLVSFVTYGHAKLVREAYGEEFDGVLVAGTLETMWRLTVALFAGGLFLWGAALGWPPWAMWPLGILAAVPLGLEAVARLRA